MNKPTTATAKCPTCKGSGVKVRAWDWTLIGGKKGKRKQTCLSCRGTGKVESDRVCTRCGNWNDLCKCGDRNRVISIVQRPVLAPPPEPPVEIAEAPATDPVQPPEVKRAKRRPAPKQKPEPRCLYGFSTCDLKTAFCGGLLCQRCGYFCEVSRHD